MSNNKENERPEGEDIYIRETKEYLIPLKIRSEVMKVLREHFKVSEKLVIESKEVIKLKNEDEI